MNLWWIVPNINYISTEYAALATSFGAPAGLGFRSAHSSFPEVFRLLGYWAWYVGHAGVPYYSFADQYSTNIVILAMSILIPALAWSSLILVPKNKHIPYFAFLALFGIFFVKGPYPPLGEIYEWLFFNFPGFWIFRNPYKFAAMIALGYTFLVGLTVGELHRRWRSGGHLSKKGSQYLPTILIVILILSNSWPLLTGDVIEEYLRIGNVPAYYQGTDEWFAEQGENFRVFILPEGFPYQSYKWGFIGEPRFTPWCFQLLTYIATHRVSTRRAS